MGNRSYFLAFIICMLTINIAFSQEASNQLPEDNPLKYKSKLQYEAIPFDKIKDEHYRPALLEGLRLQQEEVNKIANNPAKPTFENTLVAL
jgi:peptidyl-dipeptidase Dcp